MPISVNEFNSVRDSFWSLLRTLQAIQDFARQDGTELHLGFKPPNPLEKLTPTLKERRKILEQIEKQKEEKILKLLGEFLLAWKGFGFSYFGPNNREINSFLAAASPMDQSTQESAVTLLLEHSGRISGLIGPVDLTQNNFAQQHQMKLLTAWNDVRQQAREWAWVTTDFSRALDRSLSTIEKELWNREALNQAKNPINPSPPPTTEGSDNSIAPGQDREGQYDQSKPNQSEPKRPNSDQVSLEARVTAFLTDRAKVLGRIPTLDQVRTAFPGEIKPTSTFYRKNPWYKIFRSALEKSLSQFDPPIEGHRNAEEDGGGVDAVFEDADYHGGSEE